jgi:hypothetical protein
MQVAILLVVVDSRIIHDPARCRNMSELEDQHKHMSKDQCYRAKCVLPYSLLPSFFCLLTVDSQKFGSYPRKGPHTGGQVSSPSILSLYSHLFVQASTRGQESHTGVGLPGSRHILIIDNWTALQSYADSDSHRRIGRSGRFHGTKFVPCRS